MGGYDYTAGARVERYKSRKKRKGYKRVDTFVPTEKDKRILLRLAERMRMRAERNAPADEEHDAQIINTASADGADQKKEPGA